MRALPEKSDQTQIEIGSCLQRMPGEGIQEKTGEIISNRKQGKVVKWEGRDSGVGQ